MTLPPQLQTTDTQTDGNVVNTTKNVCLEQSVLLNYICIFKFSINLFFFSPMQLKLMQTVWTRVLKDGRFHNISKPLRFDSRQDREQTRLY